MGSSAVLRVLLIMSTTGHVLLASGQDKKMIACYFTNWSQYRDGVGKFFPNDVDPKLCTHVFFAFAKINTTQNNIEHIEWNYESMLLPGIVKLKENNPDLKLVLSVGGYNAKAEGWVSASSATRVTAFSQNVIKYVRANQFDGLDIDWETPNTTTKTGFIRLMKELRSAIDAESPPAGQDRLLLVCDVAANNAKVQFYSPLALGRYVDYIIVMAYDFYGFWSKQIGHHSPLFLQDFEEESSYFSQHQAVEMWRTQGVPLNKMVLGMAAYGRALLLTTPAQYKPGDPFSGKYPDAAPFTKEPGFFAYYEVCNFKTLPGWTEDFMQNARVPYVYGARDNQPVWIGYDNPKSIAEKTVYAVSRGMAGAMLWALDFDDFTGTVCGQGTSYPLLRAINQVIAATPVCKTDADCELNKEKGVCVSGYCSCQEGSFVSTKQFCTDPRREPSARVLTKPQRAQHPKVDFSPKNSHGQLRGSAKRAQSPAKKKGRAKGVTNIISPFARAPLLISPSKKTESSSPVVSPFGKRGIESKRISPIPLVKTSRKAQSSAGKEKTVAKIHHRGALSKTSRNVQISSEGEKTVAKTSPLELSKTSRKAKDFSEKVKTVAKTSRLAHGKTRRKVQSPAKKGTTVSKAVSPYANIKKTSRPTSDAMLPSAHGKAVSDSVSANAKKRSSSDKYLASLKDKTKLSVVSSFAKTKKTRASRAKFSSARGKAVSELVSTHAKKKKLSSDKPFSSSKDKTTSRVVSPYAKTKKSRASGVTLSSTRDKAVSESLSVYSNKKSYSDTKSPSSSKDKRTLSVESPFAKKNSAKGFNLHEDETTSSKSKQRKTDFNDPSPSPQAKKTRWAGLSPLGKEKVIQAVAFPLSRVGRPTATSAVRSPFVSEEKVSRAKSLTSNKGSWTKPRTSMNKPRFNFISGQKKSSVNSLEAEKTPQGLSPFAPWLAGSGVEGVKSTRSQGKSRSRVKNPFTHDQSKSRVKSPFARKD